MALESIEMDLGVKLFKAGRGGMTKLSVLKELLLRTKYLHVKSAGDLKE